VSSRVFLITGFLAVLACLGLAAAADGGGKTSSGCAPSWRVVSTPAVGSSGGLSAVAAVSTRDVWAVGNTARGPLVEHWDGSRWSVVPSPIVRKGGLFDLAAVSANDSWAVGQIDRSTPTVYRNPKPLLEHWNGKRWATLPTPSSSWPAGLSAVSAVSPADIWVVGGTDARGEPGAVLVHWDGRRWSRVREPHIKGLNLSLADLAAISRNDVWAIGSWQDRSYESGLLAVHWNGRQWMTFKGPTLGDDGSELNDVAAVSPSEVWAVGDEDFGGIPDETAAVVDHWNGKRWSVNPGSFSAASLESASAVSAHDVWAVGKADAEHGGEAIRHWNGRSWKADKGADQGATLQAVAAVGPSEVWAVGGDANGTVAEHRSCSG
jgi:hypothetical protein